MRSKRTGDRIDGATAKGGEPPIDLEHLRRRLRAMTDDELKRWGQAAARMCTPAANLGKPPPESFVIQLEEARAEWRRRKRGAK
jgi:hypothetical protein